jgi:hypothetical protein
MTTILVQQGDDGFQQVAIWTSHCSWASIQRLEILPIIKFDQPIQPWSSSCHISQMGHQRFSWELLTRYGPIHYTGTKKRESIMKDLYKPKRVMQNKTLLELDDILFKSLPTNTVLGLILHRRYQHDGNMAVRVSPVIAGGQHPDYKEKLFAQGLGHL